MHARKILAGEATRDVSVGPQTQEHGIEIIDQFVKSYVFSDLCSEDEFHPHAFHYLPAGGDHLLVQLEGRNTVRQKTTDLRITIVDHDIHTISNQDIRSAKTGRSRPDDGYFPACSADTG